jgi:hypothetical protein
MSLKSAALFALVGMILLTVVVALGFIRDISAFTSGAIAANAMLVSLIHFAGKPECDRIPVRVPQSAVLIPERCRVRRSGSSAENPATIPRQVPLRSEHKP